MKLMDKILNIGLYETDYLIIFVTKERVIGQKETTLKEEK